MHCMWGVALWEDNTGICIPISRYSASGYRSATADDDDRRLLKGGRRRSRGTRPGQWHLRLRRSDRKRRWCSQHPICVMVRENKIRSTLLFVCIVFALLRNKSKSKYRSQSRCFTNNLISNSRYRSKLCYKITTSVQNKCVYCSC
jgi:hypothetical protein